MHVVITGASRGIGAALAEGYRADGHRVTATARQGAGPQLDVTEPGSQRDFAAALDGAPVDLLICNAGVYLDRDQNAADGYAPGVWARTMAANVTGVFLTVQALLPHLQEAGAGRIAIITSRMGSSELASGGSYAYRASKAAAINLGRNLARDLAHLGLAVGTYHPGWVRTDMGGAGADIDVAEARDGLMAEFARLDATTSGCFRTWDGRDLPF